MQYSVEMYCQIQCCSPRGPIYKSLSLSSDLKSLSLDHKVFENFQGLSILETVRYVWSCDVHHCAWGYGEESSYWCQILLTDICQ